MTLSYVVQSHICIKQVLIMWNFLSDAKPLPSNTGNVCYFLAAPWACGIPGPSIRPKLPAVEAWNLNHWLPGSPWNVHFEMLLWAFLRQSTPLTPTILVQPVTWHLFLPLVRSCFSQRDPKLHISLTHLCLKPSNDLWLQRLKLQNHELQGLPELFLASPPWLQCLLYTVSGHPSVLQTGPLELITC